MGILPAVLANLYPGTPRFLSAADRPEPLSVKFFFGPVSLPAGSTAMPDAGMI